MTVALVCLLAVFHHLGVCNGAVPSEDELVVTPLGKIRGSQMASASGRKFLAFRGIPYAESPVDQLRFQVRFPAYVTPVSVLWRITTFPRRFQDPVRKNGWNGVLDARREGPTCIQYDCLLQTVRGTEDCLTLNVYTRKASIPSMIFTSCY